MVLPVHLPTLFHGNFSERRFQSSGQGGAAQASVCTECCPLTHLGLQDLGHKPTVLGSQVILEMAGCAWGLGEP